MFGTLSRATIYTPMGSPSGDVPARTTAAGNRVRLDSIV